MSDLKVVKSFVLYVYSYVIQAKDLKVQFVTM